MQLNSDRKEIYGKNRRRVGSCTARAGFVSAQIRGFSMRIRSDPVCCACGQLSSGARYAAQFSTRSRRGSLSLKNLAALLALVPFFLFSSALWAEDISIYVKVSPPLELLRSYSDPATMTLLITGTEGKPVAEGRVTIRLDAPDPGRFFSTDFPLVEGSRLLDMSLPLRQGKAEWKYLFPIRGRYRLTVQFIAPDGRTVNKTFPLRIRENEQKWFFLGIFTMGLFALGVFAGRIFTGVLSNAKGRVAGCLLVSMSCISWSMDVAAQEVGQGKYVGRLEIVPAPVGKPSSVRWKLSGKENAESRAVLLTLTIVHLEKGKTVFSVERIPVAGEFVMNFQFTDGAEYRVTANAYVAGEQMLRTALNISISGVEPPARAAIPALGFFLAVIALGLAVGRRSRRAAPS